MHKKIIYERCSFSLLVYKNSWFRHRKNIRERCLQVNSDLDYFKTSKTRNGNGSPGLYSDNLCLDWCGDYSDNWRGTQSGGNWRGKDRETQIQLRALVGWILDIWKIRQRHRTTIRCTTKLYRKKLLSSKKPKLSQRIWRALPKHKRSKEEKSDNRGNEFIASFSRDSLRSGEGTSNEEVKSVVLLRATEIGHQQAQGSSLSAKAPNLSLEKGGLQSVLYQILSMSQHHLNLQFCFVLLMNIPRLGEVYTLTGKIFHTEACSNKVSTNAKIE
ncbi:hypothetical protein RF11_03784 [Thelohanellus kitauei]|uniref:Uncharacterized protein n=1 Tax=Thelohanellus kitauei TaxID=669202 RepID=A0A0C2N4P4_THEKT|nr:hypothetical protein RF11_03784 [Thelohanellus kitauei]